MRTLTRYLLRLHLGPFLFAAAGLTLLLLLDQVDKRFKHLIGKDLHWSVISEVFIYSIPFIVAQTLPMAVLIAVLYVFSRMEADFEITAIKACGVPVARAMLPLVLCAFILAGALTWFNNTILPWSNHHLQVLITGIAQKSPTFSLREQTINQIPQAGVYLQAGSIDRERNLLADVAMYDERNGQQSRTIYADRGSMAFEEGGEDLYLGLEDGIMQIRPNERPNAFRRVSFDQMVMRVRGVAKALERDTLGALRGDREMDIAALRGEADKGARRVTAAQSESEAYSAAITRRLLDFATPTELGSRLPAGSRERPGDAPPRSAGNGGAGEAAAGAGRSAASDASGDVAPGGAWDSAAGGVEDDPAGDAAQDSVIRTSEILADRFHSSADALNQFSAYSRIARDGHRTVNKYWVEIHKKGSLPAACIVFVLIGVPIAVRFPRGGVALVIGVSLGIFGAYYVSLIGGEELADRLWISPAWAMWGSNILFGIGGAVAIARSVRVTR